MGKRKKKRKRGKRRLRKWLKACDPEISVLSLLIVQAQVADFPYFGGEIRRLYAEDPDKLLAQANLPAKIAEAWKRGQWKKVGKLFEALPDDIGPGLPNERGWPP